MTGLAKPFFALVCCLATASALAAGLVDISASDATGGIREALGKGAASAVSSLGKENGFLGNAKVRIALPDSLKSADKALRLMGQGKYTDELIEAMNRAAEASVAEAKPILLESIKKMSVVDAKNILMGGQDSVTQYFRRTSTEPLTQKFRPIVRKFTQKVKLGEQYNKFAGKVASLGLIDKKDADLDSYVTQKSLDGLFLMIAEQEKELRANPLGAASALLKKVFGAI